MIGSHMRSREEKFPSAQAKRLPSGRSKRLNMGVIGGASIEDSLLDRFSRFFGHKYIESKPFRKTGMGVPLATHRRLSMEVKSLFFSALPPSDPDSSQSASPAPSQLRARRPEGGGCAVRESEAEGEEERERLHGSGEWRWELSEDPMKGSGSKKRGPETCPVLCPGWESC